MQAEAEVPNTVGRIDSIAADGIGWIVLNNPRRLNAMALAMWRQLQDVLDDFSQRPDLRCVVVRGEGDKAFCSGADVSEKAGIDASQAAADSQFSHRVLQAMQDYPKPVIAMLAGYCLGAGASLALACDVRIAASSASFGIPAARLGLAYSYGEVKRLTDLVGPARAKQVLFTAERLDSDKALRIGLVEEVVEAADLAAFVTTFAASIVRNAPLTVQASKFTVNMACSDASSGNEIAACESRVLACLASADFAEGRLAFAQKRPPAFQGR